MPLWASLWDTWGPETGESRQVALPLRGNETGLEQAKAHQFGSPAGIGLVGFPPGDILDVRRVHQKHGQGVFEQIVDGLPVYSSQDIAKKILEWE